LGEVIDRDVTSGSETGTLTTEYRIYDVEIWLYLYVVPLLNVVICRIWMPVVLAYILLYCLLGLWYVCFLALEMRFCVFIRWLFWRGRYVLMAPLQV